MNKRDLFAALASSVCVMAIAVPAQAQVQSFKIPAGSLKEAISAYTQQTGRQVIYKADDIAKARSRGAQGSLSADAALAALLEGTGFSFQEDPSGAVAIVPGEAVAGSAAADSESAEIEITGSRIRGEQTASPTIIVSRRDMREGGHNDLGEVIRSIPQNFSGGQNPGVAGGGGQGSANQNTTSSSTLNLRGLGPDATLTLINGHRVAYDAVSQGVDISAIPVAAVERLDIVTDGASALYGSDAIGGVANIVLRRDYDGLYTSARLGTATDGGDAQQQYDVVGGRTWASGGVIGTFDYSRATAILAHDRDYTSGLDGSSTLVPPIRQYSGILSGHQSLTPNLTFDVDGTYNDRHAFLQAPSTVTADYLANGAGVVTRVESFSVAPRVRLTLGGWDTYLEGTYGKSKTGVTTSLYSLGTPIYEADVRYDDSAAGGEVGAEGPLFDLPAGAVRLAVGAGYRSTRLGVGIVTKAGGKSTIVSDLTGSHSNYYAFGELGLPVVAPAMELPGLYRLTLNAAFRYEDYPGIDRLAVPKLGLIYSPVRDVDLKISWGKSFKAPTLYQQYQVKSAFVEPASALITGYPASAAVIDVSGGNRNLQPERAKTWSTTIVLHPASLAGARLELSYFNVSYDGRVIAPPGNLTNPIYAPLVTYQPTAAQVAAAIAGAPAGLSNYLGHPFDPNDVVAIIDNRNRNSVQQQLHGIDISGQYRLETEAVGSFTGTLGASWLRSHQLTFVGLPEQQLAGTIFNQPNWRGRAGISWLLDRLDASFFFNHVGGTTDTRYTLLTHVRSTNTLDFTTHYITHSSSAVLDKLEFSLSVINLLNQAPSPIRNTLATEPPYDSTNYSAVGRFVSLTIAKQW
jgi:outer membrane receptor protein involved in Fe transport